MPDEARTPTANVDKKFEYLEALIKTNHSQLMKSIHREDNQQPKDVTGKSTPCMVEVFDQEGNDEHQTSTLSLINNQPHQYKWILSIMTKTLFDDTLKNQQEMKDVSKLQSSDANIHHTAETTEHKKDDASGQVPQHIFEGTRNEYASDKVQQNINQSVPDPIVVRSDTNTPLARNRMPSKKFKSPYLTSFRSRKREKRSCRMTFVRIFHLKAVGLQINNRPI
ncbi:hypothetical protein KY289_016747 [Solanum tuberosum]|nr:hypothetical protein KY289_016747 [Solanum tuberosum]